MTIDAPRDDLFRGLAVLPEIRAEDDTESSSLMVGHFAVFNRWTEIDSWFEGRFLERIVPGAFKKTFRENRESVKVQFDHGFDAFVGDAPLGPVDDLREDATGAYYEVPLLDTDYNRDRVLPMLQGRLMSGEQRGSVLGASFRFRVIVDEWNDEPGTSDHNPGGLPERTIKEVRLFEFGPVVFPAYEEATAGVRSLTDHFLRRRVARDGNAERAARHLAPAALSTEAEPEEPARSHSEDTRGVSLTRAQTEILKLQRRAS